MEQVTTNMNPVKYLNVLHHNRTQNQLGHFITPVKFCLYYYPQNFVYIFIKKLYGKVLEICLTSSHLTKLCLL